MFLGDQLSIEGEEWESGDYLSIREYLLHQKSLILSV